MAGNNLKAVVEMAFYDFRKISASGSGPAESSYYTPLNNLLNAAGGSLIPKMFCIIQLAWKGAGHSAFDPLPAKRVS